MTSGVVRRLSPEEEELAAKREDLARLEAELADRELALASLKAELAAFEGLYLRRVGILYAELDEWTARLAELKAKKIATPEANSEAAAARTQATESYSAAHSEAAEAQPVTLSPELKKLYREAAKRVHPDTAIDDADRARRERLMKEVNAAYGSGDESELRRILANLDNSPETVPGSGVGADLIRVLRQLRQIRDRFAAIELAIAGLAETDLAKLKAKEALSAAQGLDLFAEMAASVQGRINVIRQQFDSESNEGAKS
ncbi:MAG: J domain-containing protein [Terracidiphilus sp.]